LFILTFSFLDVFHQLVYLFADCPNGIVPMAPYVREFGMFPFAPHVVRVCLKGRREGRRREGKEMRKLRVRSKV
jgi:hypothetical protein